MISELIGALIAFLAGLWVYRDALKRGKTKTKAFLWALAVFMALIIFLPLWLITRPGRETKPEKPDIDYHPCPHCGRYIKDNPSNCPKCGEVIQGDLKVY